MKAITLSLTTQQPLLATSFQGDPNSDVSYFYIPGSMIRGAIIGRYMKYYPDTELDIANDKVRSLFFDDDKIHYLNAYLESKENQIRTLPVPRSWFKCKDHELTKDEPIDIYDFADEDTKDKVTIPDSEDEDPILKSPKSLGDSLWNIEGGIVRLYSTARRINIHNQRDRSKGRSTKDQIDLVTKKVMRKGEGEIFRYDAIDVGQTFQSVILCETDEICGEILKLLQSKDDIWLGGSQSAGYGHCKISNVQPPDSNWNEVNIPVAKRTSQDNLVITLLSNAILRDEYGQPVAKPNLVKCEIEKILEITDLPEVKPIYASNENIGGFNRKWGLPLPQVPALSMGSVFVFEGYSLTEEQIKLLELQGIGERRVDGFGRIAVNWLSESEFQAKKADQQAKTNESQLQGSSLELAEKMAERLLKQKLDDKLLDQLGRLKIDKQGISNSQLSRLRLFTRQALPDNFELITLMLNNLPSNAKKQFNTKINGVSLMERIENWLKNPRDWIGALQPVKIADVERGLTDALAIEYTLRLIEALAKKATKEGKENE